MIIECPYCKSIFNIPFVENLKDGREIKCGFCEREWIFKNNFEANNINPSKEISTSKEVKSINKKKSFNSFLPFVFFIFILFVGIYSNKDFILNKFPFFFGFFEASDILKEIISQNINWLIETVKKLIE